MMLPTMSHGSGLGSERIRFDLGSNFLMRFNIRFVLT